MGGCLLAVGDEEGLVSILDTSRLLPDSLSRGKPNAQWLGHQNAIFGLQWYQVTLQSPKTKLEIASALFPSHFSSWIFQDASNNLSQNLIGGRVCTCSTEHDVLSPSRATKGL